MATLEKIRNKAGLLVIVVGLALFSFIIGDFLRSGSTFFHQSKEKVVVVDGNSVGIREYQSRVETVSEMYKNSGGLSEEQQHQIRESIYQEMVNDILLREEGKKVGFSVGKDELNDIILGDNTSPVIRQIPDFQDPQTGQFNKGAFLQFLQLAETEDASVYPEEYQRQILMTQQYWQSLKKNIINDKLSAKFMALAVSGIAYNSLDAKKQFEETSTTVGFNFVSQAFSSISDSTITVSNAEISKLYNERKEAFKQNETKTIDYIAVNITPSQEDHAEALKHMESVKQELLSTSEVAGIVNDNSDTPYKDAYATSSELSPEILSFVQNETIGSVYGPILTDNTYKLCKLVDVKQASDSAFVNIITLPTFSDEALLKNFSDSLISVVKNGKSFNEMVLEATNGQNNGEIGWQTEYSLLEIGADQQFIDMAFSIKLNDLQVIKSTYGSILIQVTERTKPVAKYKVADIAQTVTPSTETYNSLYNDLNQYISKNSNVSSFRENATDAGYLLQYDISVYGNQNSLASIENSRQVIRWAFNSKKGSVSDIFECNDHFIAAVLTGATKEGYRSLSEVSEILKREILNKKKGEKIVVDLKAKNLSSLEQFAEAMNSTIQTTQFVNFNTPRITGIGTDPIVNAKAVASEVGNITGPFAGNNAVYVLSVTDKNTGEGVYDEASVKTQFQMQNSYQFGQAIRSGVLLQENAKIEDNRSRFY